MLIIFKSSASADVVTFEENAKQIFSVIGNDLSTAHDKTSAFRSGLCRFSNCWKARLKKKCPLFGAFTRKD